jgi:hypothetical protein
MDETKDDINFEGSRIDFYEHPGGIGEDASMFSANAQKDQFLGGGALGSDEKESDLSKTQLSEDQALDGMLKMGDLRINAIYEVLADKMTPMLFRLHTPSGQNIFYAGTRHPEYISQETRHEQSNGLMLAFDEFTERTKNSTRRIVFIEGSKPGILTNDYATQEEAYNKGEMGEITWMAKEAGIDVMSPDIPDDKIAEFMREQSVPDLTIALNFAFRNLHSLVSEKAKKQESHFSQSEVLDLLGGVSKGPAGWKRDFTDQAITKIIALGEFDSAEGRTEIQNYIDQMLPQLNQHLKENSQFIENEATGEKGIQLLVQQGTDSEGNPLYVYEYNPEKHYQQLVNPFVNNSDNPKGMLNHLSALLSDKRDQYILSQLVEKVNAGYDVFIGFGNSHAIQESAGLIAAGCETTDYPVDVLKSVSTS